MPPVVVGRGRLPTACLPPPPVPAGKGAKKAREGFPSVFLPVFFRLEPLGRLDSLQLRLSLMNRRRGLFSVNQ